MNDLENTYQNTVIEKPDSVDTPKSHAYKLYLKGDLSQKKIAESVGIGEQTISKWIKNGEWKVTRDELERDSMLRSNDKFSKFVLENREVIARQQLEQAQQLQDMINIRTKKREDGSTPFNDPRDLNMLADALKKVTDIQSRLVGIHEKSLSEMRDIASEAKKEEIWIKDIRPLLEKPEVQMKEIRSSPF